MSSRLAIPTSVTPRTSVQSTGHARQSPDLSQIGITTGSTVKINPDDVPFRIELERRFVLFQGATAAGSSLSPALDGLADFVAVAGGTADGQPAVKMLIAAIMAMTDSRTNHRDFMDLPKSLANQHFSTSPAYRT